VKHLLPLLLIAAGLALGAAGIVYGEGDDSPGLQLLGVLLVLAAVVLGVRTFRRSS
jgi:tetrahydromethanopterin S-methyltransferase subunit C